MIGGGGSIQGMITSLSNNKKLLKSKRLFKKERAFLNLKQEYFKASKGELDFKKATKEQLLEIRKKVIKERQKEKLFSVIVAFVVIGIFSYFALVLINENKAFVKKQEAIQYQKKETEFLILIEQGDEWFSKGHWSNSIVLYKKAKAIFPKNYDVSYRLARSYSFQCETDYKNCYTAKELLQELYVLFPEKEIELSEIKEKLNFEMP